MSPDRMIFLISVAVVISIITALSPVAGSEAMELSLIREAKISTLSQAFSDHEDGNQKMEASGVMVNDEFFLVVFDNTDKIARIHKSLLPHPDNGFLPGIRQVTVPLNEKGYEGITSSGDTLYALIEGHGKKHGAVVAYEMNGTSGQLQILNMGDTPLVDARDKGFEGLAHVSMDGNNYLLALCEGNLCKRDGPKNGGRLQVFERSHSGWRKTRTIALGDAADFEDYSGISIRPDGRMAIVSQEDSTVWIGWLLTQNGEWTITTEKILNFPRAVEVSCFGETYASKKGKPIKIYRYIEGVAWVDENTLVTVSDRRKKHKKKKSQRYRCKDQSIQVFSIPQ
ncbi:MAG: lactonase family protein [Gammaproteobacteria bacterium]|nr:lactonase family protein [Gammaproteobacteria bacterium]